MQEQTFDLNLLRVFKEVYQRRSVSEAAAALCLTQSAVSHALSRLRRDFGDTLFARTPTGMLPTPFADQLAQLVATPLEELQTGLRLKGGFDEATSTREFKLYLSDVAQVVIVKPLLEYLKGAAPHVRLHVRKTPSSGHHSALSVGEVDLAVGYFTDMPDGYFQRTLFREHYVCVVRAGHPEFQDGMTLEAFERVPHAAPDATRSGQAALNRSLEKCGLKRKVHLQVPQYLALPFLIPVSDLIFILPARLAQEFAALCAIKIMPLPIEHKANEINMYWHARFQRDHGSIWLRQSLANLFSETKTSQEETPAVVPAT